MGSFLSNLGRDWSFRLRTSLAFSAPVLSSRGTSLASLPEAARPHAEVLRKRFDLSAMLRAYTTPELLEGLYLLDLLGKHAPERHGPGLDVGAKNGAHLPALAAAVPGPWLGIELDGRRRYLTGVTREAYAKHLVKDLPNVEFRTGSVLEVSGTFGFISWVLPFVRPAALEAWGLPDRFFEPKRLLEHVWSLVAPGGSLFIVNQGEAEADAQHALFAELNIRAKPLGRLESPLSPFVRPRYGWLASRPA